MTPPTSTSSRSDRGAVEAAARATFARLVETWGRPDLENLGPEDDVYERLDSFAVVELLLETESEIDRTIGNESILDSTKSPLRRFQDWIDYVAETAEHG
jgi:acyl carrier protein